MAKQRDEAGQVLGPLEAELMEIVWTAEGPLAVREVHEHVNRGRRQELAYTTVMTVLSRLAQKGILKRERRGRGYVYEATVSEPAAIAVRNVMRDFGDAAVAHFVEEAKADPDALRRLKRLLAK